VSAIVLLVAAVGTQCDRHDGDTVERTRAVGSVGSVPAAQEAAALAPVSAAVVSSALPADTTIRLAQSSEPAAKARRVLHIGDSMVPLVGNYIKPAVTGQGGSYETISISSSTTASWAETHGLRDAVARLNPDLVLISLGSNELFVKDLDARARDIERIVGEAGGRACLWVGPPAWAKGFGFMKTLAESVAPCGYFDSAALRFERQADGRHPTWGASHRWAGAVWKRLGGVDDLPAG
jgi:hypothetical protein